MASAQYSVLSPQDQVRLDALAREQARQDAEYHAEMRAAKERLLRSTPLPAARNPLLGRWRVQQAANAGGKKDDLSQLLGMLNNPGGAFCNVLFGEGITEFKATTWSSIDSAGDDSLGPMQYRGSEKKVFAVPESDAFYFFPFDVVAPDRLTFIGQCSLVRVGSSAPAAPVVSARPPNEVCRATFVDQLGSAGINQVRQMVDQRFKSSQQGAVPNSQLTRVEARGSACDDARVDAVHYDFDTRGMLQAVTFVWKPSSPAPGAMFAERIKSLSLFYSMPPARDGRVELDVPLGRLTLLDVPAQNHVLESYAATK